MAAPGNPASSADVLEAGRVLATLDDWRAITFIMLFLIVALMTERLWAAWLMRREREKMWDVAQTMGANAEKIAEAMNGLRTEIVVLRAVSARIETNTPTTPPGG